MLYRRSVVLSTKTRMSLTASPVTAPVYSDMAKVLVKLLSLLATLAH